jgi:TetR/AcrR family transcriptional regulator, cholesterol catabolism regulator
MYQKILEHATERFITLGFKSVTMDEIAQDLGISKKTLYQYFSNKEDLVEAASFNVFEAISIGIDEIQAMQKNPIEEIYTIKDFVIQILKNEQTSPQYQLKKFYPLIYNNIQEKVFNKMSTCVVDSLKRGIETGIFRKEIHLEFIFRLYYKVINMIKEKELFELSLENNLEEELYLDYHIRGIATKKGLEFYYQYKNVK